MCTYKKARKLSDGKIIINQGNKKEMNYWRRITAHRNKKIYSYGAADFFFQRTATSSNVNPNQDELSLSTYSRIIIYNCQLFSGRVSSLSDSVPADEQISAFCIYLRL